MTEVLYGVEAVGVKPEGGEVSIRFEVFDAAVSGEVEVESGIEGRSAVSSVFQSDSLEDFGSHGGEIGGGDVVCFLAIAGAEGGLVGTVGVCGAVTLKSLLNHRA